MNLTRAENQIKPINLKTNVLVQELEKELLLYDLKRDKVFCLNETTLLVWNLCNGENTIEDIRRRMSIQLKTQITEELVWLALDKLKKEQLLSNHQEIEISFNGLSRRDAIRKVGISTMIALPIISAIVSPIALAAQSQGICPNTNCICQDLTCLMLGPVALLQTPCASGCTAVGGNNCQCVGPFFCFGLNERFGTCGIV